MRIISKRVLTDFYSNSKYSDAQTSVEAWYFEAKVATWKDPSEIKFQYRNASILKNNRVVFNIAGNKYRLIVSINFPAQIIYIKFIGTHQEYDQINANTVEFKD